MFAKGVDSITYEDVRRVTDDYSVAARYLGITRIPCLLISPLRKDSKPSLSIFEIPGTDTLMYHDFGTGDKGTLYHLLSELWNISLSQVFRRILKDYPIRTMLIKGHGKSHKTVSSELKVRVREWKPWDIEYWGSYGINEQWLRFGDIHPISHIFIDKGDQSCVIAADKYAYAYVERKDNKPTLKIYQPFSKEFKWMSKHDSSTWDLWTKIPENGDNLIITSSRKDALCIWANTGIPSLSLQGEGYIPKRHVVESLKERFTNIFILYDNDYMNSPNNGRIYGERISREFNLIQIEIPEEYKSKDSSDLYKNWGKDIMKSVILQLISNNS